MIDEQEVIQETHIQTPSESSEREDKSASAFAALRRKAEEAERRAQEYERLLQEKNTQKQAENAQDEDDLAIDNEDYVQAKHVKSTTKNLRKQLSANEKRLQEMEQRYAFLEAKVDTDTLKDFDSTVNDETLRRLAEKYPSDYKSMMFNPNLKERSRTAYNMIRNYGIAAPDMSQADKKIAENRQKPQLASLISPQQPSSTLGKFTDDGRRIMDEGERDRILRDLEIKKRGW